MSEEDTPNYAVFRDSLSATLLNSTFAGRPSEKPQHRRRRARHKSSGPDPGQDDVTRSATELARDADELADFIEYLATEMFESLPLELQDLDFKTWRESPRLQTQYSMPLTQDSLSELDVPLNILETLETYHLISQDATTDSSALDAARVFLVPIITSYISTLSAPPPASPATRTEACELCDRSWVPLTYHHLIPRFVHDKVLKRSWHSKEDLQNVAWLCGTCHRFVHHFKGHEELARNYYTVELLLEEEEVRKFAAWVGKLRWKGGQTRSAR